VAGTVTRISMPVFVLDRLCDLVGYGRVVSFVDFFLDVFSSSFFGSAASSFVNCTLGNGKNGESTSALFSSVDSLAYFF